MLVTEIFYLIARIAKNPDSQVDNDALLTALLEEHASFGQYCNVKNLGTLTPLMYAAYLGCSNVVATMLRTSPHLVRPSVVSPDEYTALDWAFTSSNPDPETVKTLVDYGVKTCDDLQANAAAATATVQPNAERLFATDNQNTHDPILIESVGRAIKSLQQRYTRYDFEQMMQSLQRALQDSPTGVQQLVAGFLKHDHMDATYPGTDITLKELVALVWTANFDKNIFKDEPTNTAASDNKKIKSSDQLRAEELIRCFVRLQQHEICMEGRFNAVVQTLDRAHPDVMLAYGNGAIKEELLRNFSHLFHQRLANHADRKQIILASEHTAESAQYEPFQKHFDAEKTVIVNQLRQDFPLAFAAGKFEVVNNTTYEITLVSASEYFSDHCPADEFPLDIPVLAKIRGLEKLHKWVTGLADYSANPVGSKQRQLAKTITDKMTAINPQPLTDALNDIVKMAKLVYPNSGWVDLVALQAKLPYFSGLQQLIDILSPEQQKLIAAELQKLSVANEAALDPVLDIVNQNLAALIQPFPADKARQRKLLKHVLVTAPVSVNGKNLAPLFVSAYKLADSRENLLQGLVAKNWLSDTQLTMLETELLGKDATQQAAILRLYNVFYKAIYAVDPVGQRNAFNELIALLSADKNPFEALPLLQNLILVSRNKHGDNLFHLIANNQDVNLFYNLNSAYKNRREEIQKALLAVNLSGFHPTRSACRTPNFIYLTFIQTLAGEAHLSATVFGMLKYHDPEAARLALNAAGELDAPETNRQWSEFLDKYYHLFSMFSYQMLFPDVMRIIYKRMPLDDIYQCTDAKGYTPLEIGILAGNLQMVRDRLAMYADSTARLANILAADNLSENTTLHQGVIVASGINVKAKHDMAALINSELIDNCETEEQKLYLLYALNRNQQTALHLAAELGDIDMVNFLLVCCPGLENKEKYLFMRNKQGNSAVEVAIQKIGADAINIIFSEMCPEYYSCFLNHKDSNNETLLHKYTFSRNVSVVKALLEVCPVENKLFLLQQKNVKGQTALDIATAENDNNLIDFLQKAERELTKTSTKSFVRK